MIRTFFLMSVMLVLISGCASPGPSVPEDAKLLNSEEIKAALGGKTFKFVVYDKQKSLTGTSTWDPEREVAYGEFVWDRQSPKKWERPWFVKDDWNCIEQDKGPECHKIYLDGENFFEVTESGVVHAVSMPIK